MRDNTHTSIEITHISPSKATKMTKVAKLKPNKILVNKDSLRQNITGKQNIDVAVTKSDV